MPAKRPPIDRSYLTKVDDEADEPAQPDADRHFQVPPVSADAGATVYGELKGIDARLHISKLVDIKEIRPDPAQGRRIVPWSIRGDWPGTSDGILDLFARWNNAASEERGQPFDLASYIENTDDAAYTEASGPIEKSLMDIVRLAADIYRAGGLTNAPSVAGNRGNYVIETGELRWFAYQLLFLYTEGRPEWAKMPVVIVKQLDVWKQASENSLRTDLNAIERSRTLARLIMSLYPATTFNPFTLRPGESDRWYYAQVKDGNEFPIPRGMTGQVMNAMAFKDTSLIRHYRALLRLPDDVWILADDYSLAEIRIREIVQDAGGDENVLIAMTRAEIERLTAAKTLPPVDSPQGSRPAGQRPKSSGGPSQSTNTLFLTPDVHKGLRKLTKLSPESLKQAKPRARAAFLEELKRVKDWLNTLEKILNEQS